MNKWIKISGIAIVAVLVLTMLVGGVALAQGPVDEDNDGVCDICGQEIGSGSMHGWQYHQNNQRSGRGNAGARGDTFVDENGDGVCDNFVDEDGDGICDLHGENCANFVDEDGDGICDNRAGRGQEQGYNWVDEDGDGICDMHDQAGQPGSGGRGMMRGMSGRGGRNQQNGS